MVTISKNKMRLILSGLLLFIIPLLFSFSRGQQQRDEKVTHNKSIEKDPADFLSRFMSFPEGGTEAIQKNVVYPEAARKAGLEGKVIVRVIYNENGLKDVIIKESSFMKGKDMGCHQAAIAAAKSVSWGAITGADAAGGHYDFPVVFKLDGKLILKNKQIEPNKDFGPKVSGKIYGVVKNKENGEPLIAANVIVEGTSRGAATDKNGYFFIANVPPGEYNLKVTMMGFEAVVLKSVKVEVQKGKKVDFVLKPRVITFNEMLAKDTIPLPPPSLPTSASQSKTASENKKEK